MTRGFDKPWAQGVGQAAGMAVLGLLLLSACTGAPTAPDPGEIDQDADGYSPYEGDCDDENPLVHPGATELAYDGIDNDCTGGDLVDVDEDGVDGQGTGGEDCDDEDPEVGAPVLVYTDDDGDGYGDPSTEAESCTVADSQVLNGDDCDDTLNEVSPESTEVCNDLDDDCDGETDEADAVDATTWYEDADGDGFGHASIFEDSCQAPKGYVSDATDCDDDDPQRYPVSWYADTDKDGFGNPADEVQSCDPPDTAWTTDSTDCDDELGSVHPGAVEICNGIDDDCDDDTDESDAVDALTWYADVDGDGHGDADVTTPSCSKPEGYVESATDCDDAEFLANPDEPEVCDDGIDNDCDGSPNDCGLNGTISLGDAENRINGPSGSAQAGNALSFLGDMNGDGWVDIVIGASGDATAGSYAGAAFILAGPLSSATDLSAATATLTGEDSLHFAGYTVAGTGDMDGDGFDDLVVGAYGYDGSHSYGGAAYLVHGPLTGTLDLGTTGIRLEGESGLDYAGTHVGAGDVNGDGTPDLLISAHADDDNGANSGAAYVILGPVSADMDLGEATAKLTGAHAGDQAGRSLSSAGDIDGDGIDEVLVGVPYDNTEGPTAGAVYLVMGPITADVSLALADAVLLGEAPYDAAGTQVTSCPDASGDGLADILIGAGDNDDGGTGSGTAYLVHGPVTGSVSLGAADLRLIGDSAQDGAGDGLSCGADLNGDGLYDLLIGAPGDDDGGTEAGAVHVIHAPLTGTWNLADADAKLVGEAAGDNAGTAISTAGDMNDDGFDDVMIAAEGTDEPSSGAGAVYLLRGGWY